MFVFKNAIGLSLQCILAISLVVVCNVTNVFSQNNEIPTVTVSVSAVIEESAPEIEVITVQTFNLRELEPGQQIVDIDPISSFRTGKLLASGQPGASFRISYLPTRELVNIEGTGMIFFEYQVTGNQIDEQDASEPFDTESPVLEFNTDGQYYIWVGGRVNLENATPGTYQGEFTLEIEYI
ncbi:MAG: hypothetical protein WD355_02955 [Balneolaceae bacterium]